MIVPGFTAWKPANTVQTMPCGPDDAISVEGVCKRFGENVVLDEVNFAVKRGSITALLGPSGTGKSVLLRILVGLTRPDAGHVFVGPLNVAALDSAFAADRRQLYEIRRQFGMLFQDGALFDDLNVFENVAFPLRIHGNVKREDVEGLVMDVLGKVGLQDARSKMPSELSGGMRKRVAFARAVVTKPPIVLCDEPSSGLDPVTAATLDELILEIHRALHSTFVVITHDTVEARAIADTVGMLFEGRLVHYGQASELDVVTEPALRQFLDRSTHGPIRVS